MLQEEVRKRILILDGAMGTMIQKYCLSEDDFRGVRFRDSRIPQKGNNDLLTLTRPDIIQEIHRKYLEAGADIIETNTFSSQRVSLADYGMEDLCAEINRNAVRLARDIAEEYTQRDPSKPRFVVASIGPTNKSCSISPDMGDPSARAISFDSLAEAYEEQMGVLIEEGVDAFLIETIFDTLNAKAALYAAEEAMNKRRKKVPIMLSVTLSDKAGHLLSGQTLQSFLSSVSHAPIFSLGLNCSFGAKEMKPFLAELANTSPYYVSAYPNAGLPNALGQYDQSPQEMAGKVKEFVNEGWVNIIGGCCGTTDEYIALYRDIVRTDTGYIEPHKPKDISRELCLSGLDCLRINRSQNFINIGERCNVAGSKKFRTLIETKDYDGALEVARKQVESGAQVLDINMDDGLFDSLEEMRHFLFLLSSEPAIACVPLMIDSSRWDVIETALKCVQGKSIVNSISLKEGEAVFLKHASMIHHLGAAVVVMAFDEEGQAASYERKVQVCARSYDLLVNRLNFPPEDIIFDPNILSIATGMEEHDAYALDFIRAARWIRKHLPYAHVSGGVSNLSFSFRGNNYLRQAMHAVFLYHAIGGGEGMDMGIVNPSERVKYTDIPKDQLETIENAILNSSSSASQQLIDLAANLHIKVADEEITGHWRNLSVEDRLIYALQNGITQYLEEDLSAALSLYPHAVDVIEQPLMKGMNIVGTLFGEGKMFLPQVIKTARTMQAAVAFLRPVIEKEKIQTSQKAGKILLATVKGDVHDIGKNIVSVVMGCNNFEIIDLGVMCPAESIIDRALKEKVDIIGLSGLITPSLYEMAQVVSLAKKEGLSIPIMIGGATTSAIHTALKLAPLYDGPVVWMRDASQNVIIAKKLLDGHTKDDFVQKLREEQTNLCRAAQRKEQKLCSLEEARKNKVSLFS